MAAPKLAIAFVGARGVIGTYSGIETYYEEVGSRLAERGHQVTAYCRRYFTPPVETYRGVRVRRLPSLRGKHLETISHSVLATLDALPRGFDVIQFHAIGSAALALLPRLVGVPTVVSVRGLDWRRGKWGRVARAYLRFGEWASARCPTATAVVSQTLQQHYSEAHGRRPRLIPNAVIEPVARPLGELAERGVVPDGYVLFAGRISPEKDVHTLLDAWRRVPSDLRLVIAGDSSHTDEYVAEARRLADERVIFLGRVDRAAMEALYGHCRAFVLPSHLEGLSIALLEALSYGCCILTTSIPENLEVIGDAGLVFPPGDRDALADRLTEIAGPAELAEVYRRRARRRAAERPGWDEVAQRTEELYLDLVGRRG